MAETLEVDAAELYRVDAGDAAVPAVKVLWVPMAQATWNALKAGIEALEGHSVEPASKVVSVDKVIRELQGLV